MKYRKKPVVIEAVRWTGENEGEVESFLKLGIGCHGGFVKGRYVDIGTPSGPMVASPGDYIIKENGTQFFPCKADTFKETYEPAE